MYTLAKADLLGGEWPVVVVMIFIFLIGFSLGGVTAYLVTKAVQGPIVVAGPPPAEPAVEAPVVQGEGK